jgi:hypothetical protein
MRGQASALEPLRTSRRGHQQRTTRVSLARIVQQRRAHEPAHGPLESGARHSRDLRGGPRDRGYLRCESLPTVEPSRMLSSDMIQRVCEGSTTGRAGSTMNELAPRGHLRPLGGRENPRRARPESRSPRRCAHARGAPYSPRAAPSILTKGEPTGTRAQVPSRSCTCAKALTETHPGVRMADGDWKSH